MVWPVQGISALLQEGFEDGWDAAVHGYGAGINAHQGDAPVLAYHVK